MVLLAVLAGHAELAAVDGDVHLRHGDLTRRPARLEHRDGWFPWRHRAAARSRGWWPSSARERAAALRRVRRQAGSGRRRAHAPARASAASPRSSLAAALDRASSASSAVRQAPGGGLDVNRSSLISQSPAIASETRAVRQHIYERTLRRVASERQRLERAAPDFRPPVHECDRHGRRHSTRACLAMLAVRRRFHSRGRMRRAAAPASSMTIPHPFSRRAAAVAPAPRFAASGQPPIARAEHDRMANAIRALAMDAVEQAKSGHPGLPMGAADIATVLFTRFLKFDPADPHWPDRDRFVLSAGHGSMLLYALLHLLGYEKMTIERDQALPPARLADARPSGIRPHARHRDHDRPARPGPRQCGRHGDRRAPPRRACSAATSSTITPMCSPPTAT